MAASARPTASESQEALEERRRLRCQDPEVVAAFDYASVLPLLCRS